MGVTSRADVLEIGVGPDGFKERLGGPLLGDVAEVMVTGAAETDGLAFTTPNRNRAGTGEGLQGAGCREAARPRISR